MRKALVLILLAAAACYGANIVQNPGFETGDFTDWSAYGWGPANYTAHSGSWSAGTGCVGTVWGCYVSQTLATVPGIEYDFSVWVQESAGPTSELAVQWGGVTVLDVVNPANNTWPSTWVRLTVPSLLATGSSTELTIYGRQDPAGIYIDDIAVEPVDGAVPEPATVGFVTAGLIALALRRRK
jgi:hypothetical protein